MLRRFFTRISTSAMVAALCFLVLNLASGLFLSCQGTAGGQEAALVRHFTRGLKSDPGIYSTRAKMTKREVERVFEECWYRSFAEEPYIHFKESGFSGEYVNVHEAGFRKNGFGNTWPLDPESTNIFLFGGSTMFGYCLPDDQSIAAHLQTALESMGRKKVQVYNFGTGFHYSTQEAIFFQRLITKGHVPHLAVFLDGLNEFLLTEDRPAFYPNSASHRKDGGLLEAIRGLARSLPLKRAMDRIREGKEPRLESKILPELLDKEDSTAKAAVDRYLRTKKVTQGIASGFGIRTLFVWQPVPTYGYHKKTFTGEVATKHFRSREGYRIMDGLRRAEAVGSDFMWMGDIQNGLRNDLYVDDFHYSAEFSRTISLIVADRINEILGR